MYALSRVTNDLARLQADLDRLRAERDALALALREQREQLRVAFDHVPAAVSVVSLTEMKFRYVNQAYADFFGTPLDEILNGDPYQFLMRVTHPDDLAADAALFHRLVRGEISSYQLEKRYIVRRGEIRWGLLSITGARGADQRIGYVTTHITDIHESKTAAEVRAQLEGRLRQSQKLEALGQMAGGIAHDFNNRLVVVMGYVELLKHELPVGSQLAEFADQILESAQRSAELTHQLLAFSRHQMLNPKSFEVHETLEGMRRMLQRLLGERIELRTILGAKRSVYCDPGQLEQVIMNLAVNARDAMPEGGRIIFETRDPESIPDDLKPGDYVELRVSDTGTGIPPEMLGRIFEPFFTSKGPAGGTGLGLATVDGIVRQSGGAVSVSSQVGRGSTFTVLLPAARPGQAAAAVTEKVVEAVAPPTRREIVLVCDDDDAVRKLMCDVLRIVGYSILEARDGEHALEVARSHRGPIDLLLTDAVMPRLDGARLARRLRAADPTLPVLFVSGWSESAETRAEMAAQGELLSKPFLPGDLLRAVRRILDLHLPTRAAVTADSATTKT
jgi:PAS domain S-box-containing protein